MDVLGHGEIANAQAQRAVCFLQETKDSDLKTIVENLHKNMLTTRGLVGLFGHLNKKSLEMTYIIVGNISSRIIGQKNSRLVGKDGVIGFALPTLEVKNTRLSKGDFIISYTDGIKELFDLPATTILPQKTPADLAKEICTLFGKKTDDKGCLVIKL